MDERTYAYNIKMAYRRFSEIDPGATGEGIADLKKLLQKTHENAADRERNWKDIQNIMSGFFDDPSEDFFLRCSVGYCDSWEYLQCKECHKSFCENHIHAITFNLNDTSDNLNLYQTESYVCSQCFRNQNPRSWKNEERCSSCQSTEDEFYTDPDGKPLCSTCFSTEEKCSNCRKPLEDPEWECIHMRLCAICEVDLTPMPTGDPCKHCVSDQYGSPMS